MSKYCTVVDGEVHDWVFTKSETIGNTVIWNFHLGKTFIGTIHKSRFGGYDPFVSHTPCPLGGLLGFATRHHAAEYMLKVCGFPKHPNRLLNGTIKSQKYVAMAINLEEYMEFCSYKEKLAATKKKVGDLESSLSWIENPERMGS